MLNTDRDPRQHQVKAVEHRINECFCTTNSVVFVMSDLLQTGSQHSKQQQQPSIVGKTRQYCTRVYTLHYTYCIFNMETLTPPLPFLEIIYSPSTEIIDLFRYVNEHKNNTIRTFFCAHIFNVFPLEATLKGEGDVHNSPTPVPVHLL